MAFNLTASAFIPTLLAIGIGGLVLFVARLLLFRRKDLADHSSPVVRQMFMLLLTLAAVSAVILSLPISESTRGQVLSFLGIVMTGAIALSSTTFLGNMMAGLMLRAVNSVRPGDFIRVGDHFGRVSELGFLHSEIQTEERDLTTLPNLYLVTNPVKVVRASGTFVFANISLGYENRHKRVVKALERAAELAELEDPFVHVLELGDYAISYRVAGFLREVKTLISARSRLRVAALHCLHEAGIEIVSPTFMNQRVIDPTQKVIPKKASDFDDLEDENPEKIIFDKAEEAESRELVTVRLKAVREEAEKVEAEIKAEETELLKSRLDRLRKHENRLAKLLAKE